MNPALLARVAGLLYALVIVFSVFALVSMQNMVVRGDDAATAARIMAGEQTYRLAFLANVLADAAYVAVIAILYVLMQPAGRTLSVIAAFMGLTGCAVSGATLLNQLAALSFLGEAGHVAALSSDQAQAMARHSLRLAGYGNTLGLMFFGLYCLLLASLVLRARFLPRVLGLALALAGMGWLVGSTARLLQLPLPFAGMLLPASGLGEAVFTLWLLAMGVNAVKWREQASGAV